MDGVGTNCICFCPVSPIDTTHLKGYNKIKNKERVRLCYDAQINPLQAENGFRFFKKEPALHWIDTHSSQLCPSRVL